MPLGCLIGVMSRQQLDPLAVIQGGVDMMRPPLLV